MSRHQFAASLADRRQSTLESAKAERVKGSTGPKKTGTKKTGNVSLKQNQLKLTQQKQQIKALTNKVSALTSGLKNKRTSPQKTTPKAKWMRSDPPCAFCVGAGYSGWGHHEADCHYKSGAKSRPKKKHKPNAKPDGKRKVSVAGKEMKITTGGKG